MIGNQSIGYWQERFSRSSCQVINSQPLNDIHVTCFFTSVFVDLFKSCFDNSEKSFKKVRFNSEVTIILIPTREEFEKAGLLEDLWVQSSEYPVMKLQAVIEVIRFQEFGIKKEFWWQSKNFIQFRESLAKIQVVEKSVLCA